MSIKIMCVDDSRTTRNIFNTLLPTIFNEEIEIFEAEDADEGFVILDENPEIKIIFLDINMPGMSGEEFLEIIKFKPQYDGIKVIIASTQSDEQTIARLIEIGADSFIAKPITKINVTNSLTSITNDLNFKQEKKDTKIVPIVKDNTSYKILIVDDSKTIQSMYKFHLPRLFETKIEIISANNGKEALELLFSNSDIKLIFLDINMPIMNGYQFFDTIKVIPKLKDIKVIMATTEAKKETIVKMLKAGVHGYLIKPFKTQAILEVLIRLEKSFECFKVKIPQELEIKVNSVNIRQKILYVDDSKTIRKMYETQLPQVISGELELLVAHDGKEALDIVKQNNDIDIIFLDLNMPIMDGKKALKTLRLQDKYSAIKVIICSANDDIEYRQALGIDGANGYIIKPFNVDALRDAILDLT